MKFLRNYVFPFFIVVLCVIGFASFQSNRIVRLEIAPTSIELTPGETLQMEVTAYTRDGKVVAQENLGPSKIGWQVRSTDNSFTVDENGLLTAICEGSSGNVGAFTRKGRINSAPVTIRVIAAP